MVLLLWDSDTSEAPKLGGFMYEVVVKEDGTVQKVPRTLAHTDWSKEERSATIHREYLWDTVVPETELWMPWDGRFETHQEFVEWTPVNLDTTTNQQVLDLLEAWASMQEKEKILFDVFGLEWMVRLFNHYFEWSSLGWLNDVLLPINMTYLDKVHNFPPELLRQLKEKQWEPFIAHNILEWPNWEVHFIDTDHRPLTLLWKPNPLNRVWAWITKKALADLKRRNT